MSWSGLKPPAIMITVIIKKRASACILPQLEDIPPIGPEDMGAGPSSPADRLGVSERPPLEINELGCESVIKHLDY